MEIPFPPAPDDPEAFYLLKITGRDNIGDRLPDPNDGRMKVLEYFTPEDIGVLQSTTLIQGLNENEFTPIPGLQNGSMIDGELGTQWDGLVNESYTCTIRGVNVLFGTEELGPVTWTFPANVTVPNMQVSEAEFATNLVQQLETKNAVNFVHNAFTLRLKYSEMTDFNVTTYIDPNTGNTLPTALQGNVQALWGNINNGILNSMLKADFRVTIPPIANINSISEFIEQFKSIRDGNESYVAFAGQVAQLANTAPENIIDAINKMYGATTSDQNQSINQSSVPNSFFDTYSKLRSVEKNVEILTGPGLTDPAYWAQFTTAVGSPTANFVSGFFKNKRDIENLSGNANFTGLSDTPTGYLSGQYLISTASGIDYQTISGLSKEISDEISSSQTLSFTGLSGTPSNYEQGKFLVSTDDGIEYTGNLSGVISSEEINWDVYQTPADLPNASDYHGMFAHVHSEGAAYMAHAGQWEKIYPSQGGGGGGGGGVDSESVNHDNFKDVWQLSTANSNAAEFYSILPDFIIIGNGHQTETLYLHSISGPLTNYFTYQYQSIKPGVSDASRNNVRFNTDLNGTLWTATVGHQNPQGGITSTMLLGYTSLKDFIDNDRAGYFGGSSGGGIGVNVDIQSDSNFAGIIPDEILVNQQTFGATKFQFRQITSDYIQYMDMYESNYIEFDNDSNGTNPSITNGVGTYTLLGGAATLQDIIDNGHAIYYGGSSAGGGGGGGSSTFEGLSDTPVGYDNGKILESTANGTQWVDPPAGTTEFKNLTDTPNNFDNGKILESTANGLVWVDKPAGGGGSSTFEGLTNTPSTFAGTAGQYVTVNSSEDGVQFSQLDLAGSNLNFVASQNPVQFLHKPLTSNITSNQTISDFNFTNLEVGKTYKLNAHMSFNSNIDTNLMKVDIFNGIKKLASLSNKGKSATVSTSIMFIAEVDSVHAVADAGFTSSEYIAGDPDISFVQIEMPVSAIVSVDQQTLPPTPSPAGGIFAISEINARADVFDLQEEELSQLIGPFSMQISEVQTRVQIEDTTPQTFGASFPAFSVLKIGDMKANVIIGNLNEDGTASSKIPSDTANTVNSDYRWGN